MSIDTIPAYMVQAIIAISILIAAYLVNRLLIRKLIDRFAFTIDLESNYKNVLQRFLSIIVYLIGIFIILANLGVSGFLYGLLASAGFAGIVVGMATREVLANILNGIMLMAEKPFKPGDAVVIGGDSGRVETMSFRSVTVRAYSGEKVIIPNTKVSESTIRNFNIKTRRANILLQVSYEADIRKVMKICRDLLLNNPEVLKEPKSSLLVSDFTDKGIELNLFFWLPTPRFFSMDTEIKQQLSEKLSKEGIKIALPQIKNI